MCLATPSVGLCIAISSLTVPAQSGSGAPAADQTASQLKVESNLVVLRVVVRDAQGKPVTGLKKDDFKLFDRGKEQPIAQFEEESSVQGVANPAAAQTPGQPGETQDRYIALYFDDLNTSDGDLMAARDAADRYLVQNLRASDHVAIFTTGKILSDFTSDAKQLHAALFQLHASGRNCGARSRVPRFDRLSGAAVDGKRRPAQRCVDGGAGGGGEFARRLPIQETRRNQSAYWLSES